MKNNRIVVDLNKCQYAWNGWCTADGVHKRTHMPLCHTVHGHEFEQEAIAFPSDPLYPNEDMLARAVRYRILDVWIPYTTFQVSANHRLTYTGDKAISLWKAWCEKQFNKKKKK